MINIPAHIAIIPDGNRRWAKQNKILAWKGHEKGSERFREIADDLFHRGVRHVTFWAASEDNLTKRSKPEVKFLVSLLKDWLKKELRSGELAKNEVKFRFIGRWKKIIPNKNLEALVKKLEEKTSASKKYNLTILFGYDGQREMLEAIKEIKKSKKTEVNGNILEKYLWTGELPPVDLVIRTGGEPHWSAGFMMWHTANSQFYFTETLWPDFRKKELEKALSDFSGTDRRFGR